MIIYCTRASEAAHWRTPRVCTALLWLLVLVGAAQAQVQAEYVAGPGLSPPDAPDSGLAAAGVAPLAAVDANSLAARVRELHARLDPSSRASATVAAWQAAADATAIRVLYLGIRDPAQIPLRWPTADEMHDDAALALSVLNAAHASGLDIRAFDDTLVLADRGVAYALPAHTDGAAAAALLRGTPDALEHFLATQPQHPMANDVRVRLEAAVARRLRAAATPEALAQEHAVWGTWAPPDALLRLRTIALGSALRNRDAAALVALAQVQDAPAVARMAARLEVRLRVSRDDAEPSAEELERDSDLAHDLAHWRDMRDRLDAHATSQPLDAAFWRLGAFADASLADRAATQLHHFGERADWRAEFEQLATEHVAAMLVFGDWQPRHTAALAWLGDRLVAQVRQSPLDQVHRDLLAAALAQHVESEALRDTAISCFIQPLALIEAVPPLLRAAEGGSVAAIDTLTSLAPNLAAETGLAGRLLHEASTAADPDLLISLCALARAGHDLAAVGPLHELASQQQTPQRVREAALAALVVLAPDAAIDLAQSFDLDAAVRLQAAAPLGPAPAPALSGVKPDLQAHVAALDSAMLDDPDQLAAHQRELHAHWPRAVAILGAEHLPPEVAVALLEQFNQAGVVGCVLGATDHAKAAVFSSHVQVVVEATILKSNVPGEWLRATTLVLRNHSGTTEHITQWQPPSYLLALGTDPTRPLLAAWRDSLNVIAAEARSVSTRWTPPVAPAQSEPERDVGTSRVTSDPAPGATPARPPTSEPHLEHPSAESDAPATYPPAWLDPRMPSTRNDERRNAFGFSLGVGTSTISDSAPDDPALVESFANGIALSAAMWLDWGDALPRPFGIILAAEFGYRTASETWRLQANDLSVLDLTTSVAFAIDALNPADPSGWRLRLAVAPAVLFSTFARTNVRIESTSHPDQSTNRVHIVAILSAELGSEQLFDGLPLGIHLAGHLLGYLGDGSGLGFATSASITWQLDSAISLLVGIRHHYAERGRLAESRLMGHFALSVRI